MRVKVLEFPLDKILYVEDEDIDILAPDLSIQTNA